MNFKMIGRYIIAILGAEAIFMLPALAITLWERDWNCFYSFSGTIGIILIVCLLLFLFCRKAKKGFYAREGMVSVGIGWIAMSLFGCLPFYLSTTIPDFIDALFEIVSGFTTTGASILSEVESLPKSILYWRSFSHWLGGMGVLVFLLLFLSAKGANSGFTLHLLRAESPGPNVGKLVPRMKETAKLLYFLYIALTLLNIAFLLFGKMPLFDAICTAFGTADTGGFGIKNDSIASYNPYIQVVCTVFMALFGINFSCYFLLLVRDLKGFIKDEEVHLYLCLIFISIALIVLNLRGFYPTIGETIRHAAFQVSSIITTTGFATTDFNLWPSFSKSILLFLMLIGACAGSTGGGLKCIRLILLFKMLRRGLRQSLYPNKVQAVMINRQPISDKVLRNTSIYLIAYCLITAGSILLISMNGFSFETNISAVIACFNNIGPGFDQVGATGNYGAFDWWAKLILIFDMLAGRLEILPIMILFTRSTWRRK